MTDPARLLIGGEWVAGDAGAYPVVNPATEQPVGEAPEASPSQAEAACEAAAHALPAWADTSVEERASLLERAADRLQEHVDELVPLVQAETGATMRVTRSMQVPTAIHRLRYYARAVREPLDIPLPPAEMPATALAPGGLVGALARRAPVGVVAAITPYNFPIVNTAGKIGPALAMGNPVVIKPAVQDPLAVIRMVEIMEGAGFPPGVLNVITSSSAAPAEAIVASPHTDMVSFTGSTGVGSRIAEVAAPAMTRLLLELGGKGAAVVFDDADLKAATAGISSVWSFHSGQICTAPTRAVIQRAVYDDVVERLAKAARVLKVGDPTEPDTVVGPVISDAHRGRIEGYVATGRKEGAEVVVGGERPEAAAGFYVAPTLLAGATNQMTPAREEIFGPVVVAIPFDDDDEGVAIANDSPFGLYSYVFSGDGARAMRVARSLRSGNVGINTLQRNHEAPFGGMKMSGVGRDGGRFALHAYSELQSITWSD